jgi:hypothetical protein
MAAAASVAGLAVFGIGGASGWHGYGAAYPRSRRPDIQPAFTTSRQWRSQDFKVGIFPYAKKKVLF